MTLRPIHLAATLAFATLTAASAASAPAADAPRMREVVAKVVAVNLQSSSIEAEVGAGDWRTYAVVGKAAEDLDRLPIGGMFTLTLQDGDDGARGSVIAIKRAKGAPRR